MYDILRQFFVSTLISLIAIMGWQTVLAQPVFNKPVTMIVPYQAGSGSDGVIRTMQLALSQDIKTPLVIQNMPGAAGQIGTQKIATSPPNGNVFGMSMGSTIGIVQLLSDQLPYNYTQDFEYVAMIGEVTRSIIVNTDSPYKTFAEFVLDAGHNKKLNIGAPGASSDLLTALILKDAKQLQYQLIPYSGTTAGTSMLMDLAAGRIDAMTNSLAAAASCLQAKTCRPLVITTSMRHLSYPDVPTLAELGYKSTVASYYGIIAPKETPRSAIIAVNHAVNKALNDPDISKILAVNFGIMVTVHSPMESQQLHFQHVEQSLLLKKYLSLLK